jgi:RNA polymerase-binding transcription factor DksA
MDTVMARKRLEELRDSLDRSISVLGGSGPERGLTADYPPDPADAGANLSESERAAAMMAAVRQQRTGVLSALGRIQQGTYGLCADCGKPVPEGRLEAKPAADCCVTCQAKRDRRRR